MLRFYKETMERVLTALLYAKGKTRSIRDLQHYAESFQSGTGNKLDVVLDNILHRTLYPDETLDDLITAITDQLYEIANGTKEDVDFIDTIVRLLQLPYARNGLSSRVLTSLRKALLLPSEMAAVTTHLSQRELTCAMCNHIFSPQEMTTVIKDGTDVVLYCTRCCIPLYMSCSSCERVVAIDKKLSNALYKTVADCGNHDHVTKKKEKEPERDEVPPPGEPVQQLGATITFTDEAIPVVGHRFEPYLRGTTGRLRVADNGQRQAPAPATYTIGTLGNPGAAAAPVPPTVDDELHELFQELAEDTPRHA